MGSTRGVGHLRTARPSLSLRPRFSRTVVEGFGSCVQVAREAKTHGNAAHHQRHDVDVSRVMSPPPPSDRNRGGGGKEVEGDRQAAIEKQRQERRAQMERKAEEGSRQEELHR